MKPKIVVATPLKGDHVSLGYHLSMLAIHRAVERLDIAGDLMVPRDIVRSRNRLVRLFLQQTDGTHLLFVDSDVVVTPEVIVGMLRQGEPCVFAPYPKRDGIDWKLVGDMVKAGRDPLDAVQLVFRMESKRIEDTMADHDVLLKGECIEVHGGGLGCALLRRDMLEQMTAHYGQELASWDDSDDPPVPQVSLFRLAQDEFGRDLSEDNSFFRRWRLMGGKVWMYLGDGSPVKHQGQMVYRGSVTSVLPPGVLSGTAPSES